ncbi:MAG: hypothetical protein J2P41_22125 [Blastocatellia bacterium]|nr:hypothetical protein [Blastocatellia bacterium]
MFGRKEQNSTVSHQSSVKIDMPAGLEGKTVSSNTVMMALLWQQYGIDMLHPEFSCWLDQNAPDVKYAVARSDVKKSKELRVGADGTINVRLTPEVEGRLREISSQYIFEKSQVGN